MADLQLLIVVIRTLHHQIRERVTTACETAAVDSLARISHESTDDTIYAIDRVSEETLVSFFAQHVAPHTPIILIGEGLADGQIVLPPSASLDEAVWRIIVDPIDGTRGLMYQKRSGWILTGVAPNHGPETNLQDIIFAMQTELPLVKQHLSDQLWAVKGEGVTAVRYNRLTDTETPLNLRPSQATTIAHGFATVSRFFPGLRVELSQIDEAIMRGALGPVQRGKAQCFEDQYICSGGQLYELMVGHDRFVADLRPLLEQTLTQRGLALGICAHPYDLCTELIARELGLMITDGWGNPLIAPLDTHTEVDWLGYANEAIRQQIEPLVQDALRQFA